MKFFRLLSIAYLGVVLVNLLGCEAPHSHHTEVLNERIVEQTEVVE